MTERKAGRELDALIVEKVMGEAYPPQPPPDVWPRGKFTSGKFWEWSDSARDWVAKPFSTSIADAWEVLQKMAAPGHRVELTASGSGQFDCSWWLMSDGDPYDWDCLAEECDVESAPLAICLAALSSFPDSTKEGE